MFLKRITIKGFKSFANKVKVDFEPAITGVIGPNGSGKSNISDAIRWVLGEQSAKTLRGGKMEDVIFAGSKDRRALGIAEVYLTLDNRNGDLPIDYKEVTIGRRVSRSGDSDYLINNNICRLKDVKELFMDTGVGKDAYSIIGQGKVEAILSERSVDRRELFEEAAGITKHKSRKEEALRKLDNTQQKLQRIEDIISEIERQIGPLKKESKKAIEYKDYQGQLKELEVNLLLNKYNTFDDKLDEKLREKQSLSYKLTQAKAAVSEYDLKMDKYKQQSEELTTKIDQEKDKIFEAKSNVERIENKLKLAREKKDNLVREKKRLNKEVVSLNSNIELNTKELDNKKIREDQLEELIEKKEEDLRAKESLANQIQEELAAYLSQKSKIEGNRLKQVDKISDQRHRLKSMDREIQRDKEDINKLKQEKEELARDIKDLESIRREGQEGLEETKDKLNTLSARHKDLEVKVESLKSDLHTLQKGYESLKGKYNSKRSRFKVLKGMEENYEGYYRGVKNLLKATKGNNDFKGVCGVVAELINTPKEYDTAIEIALGGSLQNIVVEDDKVGKRAINYLKKNRMGRATFLPINLVSRRYLNNKEKGALDIEGVIGIAKDLVSYDQKYRPVFESLLGRVIIAKDMDVAVKVSKATNKRVKVVTLQGDLINPGGAMTGGSRNQNNNLLGRSREIEKLDELLKGLSKELKLLEEAGLEKRGQLLEAEGEIKELNKNIHSLEIEKNGYSKDIEGYTKEIDRLNKEIDEKDKRSSQLKDKIDSLEVEKGGLSKALEDLNEDGSNIKEIIKELEDNIEANQAKKEECNELITDLKVEIASLRKEKEGLREDISLKERSIKGAKEGIQRREASIKRLENKDEDLEDQRSQLHKDRELKSQEVFELKNRLDGFRDKKKEADGQIAQFLQESKEIREQFNSLQEGYNKVEVELAQLKVKVENTESRLREEYDLEACQAVESRVAIDDYSKVEKRIKELKRLMKGLEPVNLTSIEEYESLKERFDFLREQHDDLVEAKESLEKVISEMEEEMKEKFAQTFKQVKAQFEEIFVDLFGGGRAQLALEDEDDLLETGIEINAQPPGKKLQKLSLMSGGEKALTATALIFSLLKVNPSPFYVLDELDAPLDDANVNRFAAYLRRLSEISQFIVITHRKGTMEAANALYGVTMQESGVSEMVSLRMDDLDEYEE
ncbi:chromosome segregation protein SMC [Halonatronum saccharophilum]|uniref:chromosome segregation protein SMC n=1 Tax=Halonatronum saccharophilum TaxID=150060 RepID=UPI0004874B7C|nr:chromosome segregation protein SMC [Halonatronum saccharophilum]